MPCTIAVLGSNLDIDEFLSRSKLKVTAKTYKGQPRFRTKPDGEKIPYSFIATSTSNAGFDNLPKQITDTIRYLKRNREKLRHISTTKGVQYATLDFGIDLRIDRKKVLTQSEYFPSALVKLAGELGLGIEVSIYPTDLQSILEKRVNKKRSKGTAK
jgi:hypothetical protein